MHCIYIITILLFVAEANMCSQEIPLFSLTDSNPDSPNFRRRFMALNGVHEPIEPKLTPEDRPLQNSILPWIKENPKKAIELIEAKLGPTTNPAFLNILGNLYYQIGDYKNSEHYMLKALEQFPSLRRSWRTLALGYVQINALQKAVQPLLKVIQLGGGDAQSYGLLAYAYLNAEKYESALAAYRMARMFDPDSFDFRRGQAICLLQTHQLQSAIALFDELILESPKEASFWMAQANAFISANQKDQAIANLQLLADLDEANWESLQLLGNLYLNQNLTALALDAYSRAFQKHAPKEAIEAIRPLDYLLDRGLYKEAKTYHDLISNSFQTELDDTSRRSLRMAHAKIEINVGDREQAVHTLRKAIREDPMDGASLLLLGKYYFDVQMYEEAIYHLERASSVKNTQVDALIALGQLEVKRGNLEAALSSLRKAEQVDANTNLKRFIESIERALKLRR